MNEEEERREAPKDLHLDPVQFAYEQSGELANIASEKADPSRKSKSVKDHKKTLE
ncbi:hypothetical protein JOD24_002836 [Kroppenstedtia sanguinis]|uniref:YfhD-like protein n=1 Tax=Kroppenstedtia sanguinis TaxID=1380684 RepID=A0ABW4CC14_9BACL